MSGDLSGQRPVARFQDVTFTVSLQSSRQTVDAITLAKALGLKAPASGWRPAVRIRDVRHDVLVDYGSSTVPRMTPEQLCAQYATKIARFASIAADNDGDADDIAQDALLKAIGALDKYDSQRGPLDAWLWRIVANTARDAGRRARIRTLFAERFAQPPPSTDPEAAAIERATSSEVYAAIAHLNPRDRELLALRFGSELSTSEVGAVVGLSAESARRAIGRALERLRVALPKGVGDERV